MKDKVLRKERKLGVRPPAVAALIALDMAVAGEPKTVVESAAAVNLIEQLAVASRRG